MIGAIAGDIIGSAYEFNNTRNYGFRLFTRESNFTDDSIMTMAVAYWLLTDHGHTHQGLEDVMVQMAKEFPCPMGGYGTGFEVWLSDPGRLYRYDPANGPCPYESRTGRHPYGSYGNGSAMRVSPVGWYFDTLEETEMYAKVSAEVSHNHPEGIKGAQATAAAIFLARTGRSKEEIREYIELRFGYDLSRSYDSVKKGYGWDESCQGTVPEAIICFLESGDYEDAVRLAVSLGGDSDTLGCITGSIAEAFYKEIPSDIVRKVLDLVQVPFNGIITHFAGGVSSYGEVFQRYAENDH